MFLEFLQDMNWPAARGAAKMLVKAGPEIIPEIKRVFKEVLNDEIWHYWILIVVVQELSSDLVIGLRPEMEELVKRADKEGASIQALKILKEKGLLKKEEMRIWYQYLLEKYKGDDVWIDDLNEEIKPDL